MNKTIGEKRVRCEFNPSNNSIIDQIKQKSAELINLINDLTLEGIPGPDIQPNSQYELDTKPEFEYLKEMGTRQIEDGCMWAVKAVTIKL